MRDLRGERTKISHKDPNNKSSQQISQYLEVNVKNENSSKIHPRMEKNKTSPERDMARTRILRPRGHEQVRAFIPKKISINSNKKISKIKKRMNLG